MSDFEAKANPDMSSMPRNKYEFTGETRMLSDGVVLHRIRAIRCFRFEYGLPMAYDGKLGGWVESEANLPQDDDAWVAENACVFGHAKVEGSSLVKGEAMVFGEATIRNRAIVSGLAKVYDKASVYGNARVYGGAEVRGSAEVFGDSRVYGYANVGGRSCVYGESRVCGKAFVSGDSMIIHGAFISGDAKIASSRDYSVFINSWSSFRLVTYTRSNGVWNCGCFNGTGKELIAKAYRDSELSGRCYEAIVRAQAEIDSAVAAEKEVR